MDCYANDCTKRFRQNPGNSSFWTRLFSSYVPLSFVLCASLASVIVHICLETRLLITASTDRWLSSVLHISFAVFPAFAVLLIESSHSRMFGRSVRLREVVARGKSQHLLRWWSQRTRSNQLEVRQECTRWKHLCRCAGLLIKESMHKQRKMLQQKEEMQSSTRGGIKTGPNSPVILPKVALIYTHLSFPAYLPILTSANPNSLLYFPRHVSHTHNHTSTSAMQHVSWTRLLRFKFSSMAANLKRC